MFFNTILDLCTIYIITNILVYQDIFERLRAYLARGGNWTKEFFDGLLSCFFCTSCWISTLVFIFALYYEKNWTKDIRIVFLYIIAVNVMDYIRRYFKQIIKEEE